MRDLDDITGGIVDASLRIHRDLGPGLLQSVYEAVLVRALDKRGFQVERQKAIHFEYEGMVFEEGFRTDLFVDSRVIVELKSVERLAPVQQAAPDLSQADEHTGRAAHQLWRRNAAGGVHRIVNGLPASASPRLGVNQSAKP